MPDDLITNDEPLVDDATVIDDIDDTPGDDDIPDDIPEFVLGEETVPLDEIEKAYKAYKDNQYADKVYTQRNQALADDRRQLEAREETLRQREASPQQTPAQQQPSTDIPEEIADDPALAMIYKELQSVKQENQNLKQGVDDQQTDRYKQDLHRAVQSKNGDYDSVAIERHVMDSPDYNPFEDAYLANQMRALTTGDSSKIMDLVPDSVKKDLIKEGRDGAFADIRKKAKLRDQASTPTPTRGAVITTPKDGPKNYKEAKTQSLDDMKTRGLSLFSD